MDKTPKKYRNYEKTETAIKDALVFLCNKKRSIDKVTVKELCETANISKSTFYLHYKDIKDIFDSVGEQFLSTFEEIFDELLKTTPSDFLIYINQVFDFLNKSSKIIKIGLTMDEPSNYYVDGIKKQLERDVQQSFHLMNRKIEKEQLLAETRIVSGGVIDFILDLLRSQKPLEEHASTINNFLNKWVKTLE